MMLKCSYCDCVEVSSIMVVVFFCDALRWISNKYVQHMLYVVCRRSASVSVDDVFPRFD